MTIGKQLSLSIQSFTKDFYNYAGGGMGMSFIIQNSTQGLGAQGSNDESRGYLGMPGKTFALVFDTYDDEIWLLRGGSKCEDKNVCNPVHLIKVDTANIPSFDDNTISVRLFYVHSAKEITLSLNGQFKWSASVDMAELGSSDGKAWVGFGASNAYTYASYHSVSNWRWKTAKPHVGSCVVKQEGKVIGSVHAREGVFTLDLRDSCKYPRHFGGENPLIQLVVEIFSMTIDLGGSAGGILDNRDGTYQIKFVPPAKGTYKVKLKLPGASRYTDIGTVRVGD